MRTARKPKNTVSLVLASLVCFAGSAVARAGAHVLPGHAGRFRHSYAELGTLYDEFLEWKDPEGASGTAWRK